MENNNATVLFENVDDQQGPEPEYVWFWRRAAGRLIDIVFFYIVNLSTGLFVGVGIAVFDQTNGTNHLGSLANAPSYSWTGFLIGTTASFLYHTLLEGLYGSALGKLIVGITVLRSDLRPCGFFSALLRSVAFLVDGLVFGGVAAWSMQSSETNQRLGDRWADSVVVRKWSVPPESRRSVLLFLVALFVGVFVYVIAGAFTVLRLL